MWPFHTSFRDDAPAITVRRPHAFRTRRGSRVTALVDGRSVWFESNDAMLVAATEAFGASLVVPAMHAGRPLHLEGTACETWATNLRPLSDMVRGLWYPDASQPHAVPERRHIAPSPSTALCFTGGVDAFYTYFESRHRIDQLAYVVGYDVKLRQRRRAAEVSRMVRAIAAETGRRGIVIRTNLRQHPLMRAAPWVRAFGGALAAVAHLLAGETGRLLISGDGLGFEHPEVGSRAGTDHLHGSAAVAIEHTAPTVTRLEKIRRIAQEPLVQRNLRVCWQNVSDRLNCGRCEKCIRTMLSLDACGVLGSFAGFGHGRGLVAAIDALPAVDGIVASFYRDLLAAGLAGGPAAGVRRLIERSGSRATAAPQPARGAPAAMTSPKAVDARPLAAARQMRPRRHRLLGPAMFADVCEPLVGRRVGYVRPEGNVGDQLIELAMAQLFATYGIRWSLVALQAGPRGLDGLDVLVFGGGGNMGTRYTGNHELRGRALATGLPLVILPQSFTTPEDRPFHRVYVRERGSLALRPDGILAPDLALGLEWPEALRPTHELGVYLRRDQERGGRKPLLARDPVRLAGTPAAYLAFAARHRRIVTDRLHFAVAGLHAGREVTLVANDYHKNRSMHETWLADLGCRFVASPAEALGRGRRAA
jgi:hypothetical protein